jgi:hypothetical protein
MTSEEAYGRYLHLAAIRSDLRSVGEHGLANLVNDRMCAVHNFLDDGQKKAAAMELAAGLVYRSAR